MQVGFRFLSAAALALAAVFLADAAIHTLRVPDRHEAQLIAVSFGASVVGVATLVGLPTTFAGRFMCLDTPPDLPTARARIWLAVLLDGCGLLSFVVNLAVGHFSTGPGAFKVPEVVWYGVFVFSFVLLLAARAFFLAYLRSLARAVDYTASLRLPVGVLIVVVSSATVVATIVGLHLTSGITPLTVEHVGLMGVCFVATLAGLSGLYLYGRTLRELRSAVQLYDPSDLQG